MRRRRAPRGAIAARRALAVVVVLAILAGVGWGASRIVASGGGGAEKAQPDTTVTTSRRPPRPLRIIFPEGFTRREMAERIAAVNGIARRKRGVRPRLSPRAYLRLTARSRLARGFPGAAKARSLEGFLFPALYDFTPRTPTRRLVEDQLDAFRRNWSKVNLRYARSRKLTPYDVLIIASMIEEEVRVPRERRLVAAVVYNRLRAGMHLGIDATIRYALDVPPTEPLRRSQLENPTPYNTRLHAGLPPTPITNPGLAAMRAAANPARTDYLYFVRKPDHRSHFFTASAAEFDRKLCEYGYTCG